MGVDIADAALVLWAKSGNPYHPLLGHMLDAAAVAQAILFREPHRTLCLYAQDFGLKPEEAVAWVAFLTGLHDLGKASPVFQAAWAEGAARVWESGLTWNKGLVEEKASWVAHGVLTELYVRESLRAFGVGRRAASKLAWALGAHHGFPARKDEVDLARLHMEAEPPAWAGARKWLVERLYQAIGVRAPEIQDVSPQAVLRVMALTSFADWIASDPGFFPYGRDPTGPDYWREALELAEKALDRVGWRRPGAVERRDFAQIFTFPPNELQRGIPLLLEGTQEPILLLVEAPMGMGKTEAALYAYHLLVERLSHRGLYMALPTQATANGLFPRVRAFLESLGVGPLDLQLQHGTAMLNPLYEDLLERAHPAQVYEDDGQASVSASAWFSAKKRAMLSPHGVGTLDQALLGVLTVKHHFVRLWGLMNRVVVLDEVHAYDTYTSGLLEGLLRWLKSLGSSVILMTATLPKAKREALLAAWGVSGEGLPPYPRLAVFGERFLGGKSLPYPERTVALRSAPVKPEALAKDLRAALPGALGAVVNTVDRAQALYLALGEGKPLTLGDLLGRFGPPAAEGPWMELWQVRQEKAEEVVGKALPDGTLVFLLHARFPAEERALRETVALALFGKRGPRPERAILVATQVAEQSLDLDFDLLYSDLAPVDLLFQRAGRLHRHKRPRPPHHGKPQLWVGGLEEPRFGGDLYWDRVYEEYVLLSTWVSLQGRDALRFPQDLEALLEEVYERKPEAFPAELQKRAQESHRRLSERWLKEAETAKNVALSDPAKLTREGDAAHLAAGFRLDDEAESPQTQRLLTRLGEPSVAVVPLYRIGETLYLDPQGRRPARLKGKLAKEEAVALWRRAVRLSRFPIPQELSRERPPASWSESGLLHALRPLEVGRVFGEGRGAFRVELHPELGVVYVRLSDNS
ncbi:CRISPR-associated helicase Cas3' [Thermus hydrothermalis]|uniref:CRISPR-associated helicase Cas3' n=1 Tax=Thermus hydrothermalis TaxID=2908148 RepID=UPI001FAA1AF0|nr:CRISPR-associated helicase Cas3' [Thermus hydrothermalis]